MHLVTKVQKHGVSIPASLPVELENLDVNPDIVAAVFAAPGEGLVWISYLVCISGYEHSKHSTIQMLITICTFASG